MNPFADMIDEASARLFAPHATPVSWRAAERGEGFDRVWAAIEDSGFLDLLTTDGEDAADVGSAAYRLIRNAGRALLPAPLGETMLARAVLIEAGLTPPPAGPLAVAANRAAYGRHVAYAIVWDGDAPRLARASAKTLGVNAAGEPRDDLALDGGEPIGTLWTHEQLVAAAALIRAGQIAGALERVLTLTVDYARTRKQFGKPIGQFQAVQQQLAILAGQTASACAAAEHAFRRWRHQDFVMLAAAAKIRAGEAAGVAISVAHQTHGAIGITDEHELHFATRRLHSWRAEYGGETRWAEKLGAWAAAFGPEKLWNRITMC